MENILFNHPYLDNFISAKNYSGAAALLLEEQKKHWADLSKNYNSISNVEIKSFRFGGFTIRVQHNPGRFLSSSANVDSESIKERKCFLCSSNLYEDQKTILYKEDFLILVNPFPIFPEHFTIAHLNHIPQKISGWFGKMLSTSKDFLKYAVIYNGPECGASAPDHLHFQAGTKEFLSINDEFHSFKNKHASRGKYEDILTESDSLTVSGVDDGLRRYITIETLEIGIAEKVFDLFYDIYSKISASKEPMMNIISFYEQDFGWKILIFLRAKHRPSQYYKEGENKILLSPAAVDLGGVCILPLEKDFKRISKEIISEIFKEVSLGKEQFDFVKFELKKALNG